MTYKSNQSSHNEEEMDLREIINILIKSKKLIISTILIFTIVSIVYSLSLKPSFKSSMSIEIGFLYDENDFHKSILIEPASTLASALKIELFKKNLEDESNRNVIISEFENKIITLETTSGSVEINENLLTELVNFIYERHSNIKAKNKNLLIEKISSFKSEKAYLESSLSNKAKSEYLNPIQNSEYIDRLFSIDQKLINLTKQIEKINSTNQSNTKILKKAHKTLKPHSQLTIILSIIIGFITSIFLTLIVYFIKNYRVSKE